MEEMTNIGKIVAAVLVITCTVAVMSIPVVDADDAVEPVQIDAVDFLALTEDGRITLESDFVLTTALEISDELVIDLNGHTIVNGTSAHTIAVLEGGNLTVIDSVGSGEVDNTVNGKAALAVWPGAIAYLYGGIFDRSAETGESIDVSGDNSWYTVKNQGTLTIDGAEIRNSGSFSSCINNGWYDGSAETAGANDLAAYAGVNAKLYIFSGTVDGGINSVKNDDAGELYISGGTFTNTTQATILNWNITEISGGYFESGKSVLMNGWSNDTIDKGQITVTGGVFIAGSGGFCATYFDINNKGNAVYGITGGLFSFLPDSMVADGCAKYEYADMHLVSVDDVEDAQIVIADIPFASVSDALALINVAGDFAVAEGDTLILIDDLTDTGNVALIVPEGEGMTIDLNGHRIVLGDITVNGALNIADSEGEGSLVTSNIDIIGGSIAGSGVIAGAEGIVNLIDIIGSGCVSGVTLDVSDVASNGGAIDIQVGLTGSAVINGVTVLIDAADAVADRGIYVNQMSETGSVVIGNVTFDFNGNDACPINADVYAETDLAISDIEFMDCTRTNKVLLNSIEDVTIGSEGGISITDVSDVVLWDASASDKKFTVAGDLIVNGRMAAISGGNLVIPDDATMTVNGSIELASDSSIEGTILFGSDGSSSLELNDVVAGADGLKLSLGSVVMSGAVASGSMRLTGTGTVDGALDLGESKLTVPEDSVLNIPRNSSISGTSAVVVEGKVNVYGSLAAPVQNDGAVYIIGSGEVTGSVEGNEVQEKVDEPLSIDFVPNMTWTVGESKSISLGLHPIDAVITGITGADWLTFNGHVISGTPTEAGTYEILLTVGLDDGTGMETDQADFIITVTETPVDDEPVEDEKDPLDWKLIAIIFLIVVIAILVVRTFLG